MKMKIKTDKPRAEVYFGNIPRGEVFRSGSDRLWIRMRYTSHPGYNAVDLDNGDTAYFEADTLCQPLPEATLY